MHSTVDTVYTVGSAVVGSYFNLAFYRDAAIIIIYKISCGFCGGPTSICDVESGKKPDKVAPFGI